MLDAKMIIIADKSASSPDIKLKMEEELINIFDGIDLFIKFGCFGKVVPTPYLFKI